MVICFVVCSPHCVQLQCCCYAIRVTGIACVSVRPICSHEQIRHMLPAVRFEVNKKRRASLRFPPANRFSSTVPVCFPHLSPAKAPLIYLLLSLSLTFPPSATLCSIHPFILRLILSQLSNLIPHLWTAWDISPEMRSVTLNTGVEDSARGGQDGWGLRPRLKSRLWAWQRRCCFPTFLDPLLKWLG